MLMTDIDSQVAKCITLDCADISWKIHEDNSYPLPRMGQNELYTSNVLFCSFDTSTASPSPRHDAITPQTIYVRNEMH